MTTTAKTCATCFHFNPEPYFDFDTDMPAGCGEGLEQYADIDPLTGKQAYRAVIASDTACHLFLTHQEGHLWEAGHGDQFEKRYEREAAKQRFTLIQRGQA